MAGPWAVAVTLGGGAPLGVQDGCGGLHLTPECLRSRVFPWWSRPPPRLSPAVAPGVSQGPRPPPMLPRLCAASPLPPGGLCAATPVLSLEPASSEPESRPRLLAGASGCGVREGAVVCGARARLHPPPPPSPAAALRPAAPRPLDLAERPVSGRLPGAGCFPLSRPSGVGSVLTPVLPLFLLLCPVTGRLFVPSLESEVFCQRSVDALC